MQAQKKGLETWKWFGDSKVVDSEGLPLVVYHGSPLAGINVFDRTQSKTKSSGLKEFGLWFTTNRKLAERYKNNRKLIDEKNNEGEIYAVYLSIRNLSEFDGEGKSWENARYNIKVNIGYKVAIGIDAIEALAGKNKAAQITPADGVKLSNVIELNQSNELEYVGDSYLVFDNSPTQIKSIDNVGTFDPENEDIRFRERYENSGYNMREDGTYASVNAIDAEKGGTFTAGVFKRKYGVSAKDFDVLIKLGFINQNEWHHTGKSFRQADFYSWVDSERVNGDVSYNEEGNWESEEGNSLAGNYIENKKEISKLIKQLEEREWQYKNKQEIVYFPPLNNNNREVALKKCISF